MSDTPILDAVDAAQGLKPPDFRTPAEIAREQRQLEEEKFSSATAQKRREKAEFGKNFAAARSILGHVIDEANGVRNGKEVDVASLTESTLKDLGGTPNKAIVSDFVKRAVGLAHEGMSAASAPVAHAKGEAGSIDLSVAAAESIVTAGWEHVKSTSDPNRPEASMDDVLAQIPSY